MKHWKTQIISLLYRDSKVDNDQINFYLISSSSCIKRSQMPMNPWPTMALKQLKMAKSCWSWSLKSQVIGDQTASTALYLHSAMLL